MSDPLQDGGADSFRAPPPPRKSSRTLRLPQDLLAFVRRRVEAGYAVGRTEVMRMFGVSREQIDKAWTVACYEHGLTVEEKVAQVFRLVGDDEVWKAAKDDITKSQRKRGHVNAVRTELGVRRKHIEERRRALANANSPVRLALNAAIGLRDGAMVVQGVGELLDQMIAAERETLQTELDLIDVALLAEETGMFIDALAESKRDRVVEQLRAIAEAVSMALEKILPEQNGAPQRNVVTVDGESWQPGSVRALPR
jgi:hypothetical protein